MREYFQILILVIIGVAMLWFGYTLLMGQLAGIHLNWKYRPRKRYTDRKSGGTPGDPQVCPICSSRLYKGELVKTLAFPSITGGKDRLVHIRGCMYCLNGDTQRYCPVCGKSLDIEEILVARMFERSLRRTHVHVLGCSQCRRVGKL